MEPTCFSPFCLYALVGRPTQIARAFLPFVLHVRDNLSFMWERFKSSESMQMCVFKDTFSHSVFSRPMMRLQTSATLNLSNNILSQHFMRVGFLTFLSSQIIPSSFFSCRPYFSKLYHLLPHTLEMLEPYSHKRKINRPCIDEFLMTSKIVSQFFPLQTNQFKLLRKGSTEHYLYWVMLCMYNFPSTQRVRLVGEHTTRPVRAV